jgi:hypothetical protein
MDQHLNFQHSFWDVIQEVTLVIIAFELLHQLVLCCSLCDKRILLERGLPYTLKSPNKTAHESSCTCTFLHFVVSLQNRFYTLGLIFVFDVNIYSCSSSYILPATNRTLASRYFCFKYLDRVKRVSFQASDIAKRLGINFPVIL